MINLSDRLHLLCGNLEPFEKSGGTVTGEEIRFLTAELRRCAEFARTLQFDLAWANRQLDEIVEDAGATARANAPPPRTLVRRLRVIAGGRA